MNKVFEKIKEEFVAMIPRRSFFITVSLAVMSRQKSFLAERELYCKETLASGTGIPLPLPPPELSLSFSGIPNLYP